MRRQGAYIEGMDKHAEITLTRNDGRTYSWQPQSRLSRLLVTLSGLALLTALAAFAIGAILVGVVVAVTLIAVGLIRAQLRRSRNRRRQGPTPPGFYR